LLGISDKDPQVLLAAVLMLFGAGLLIGLEKLGTRRA